MSQATEDTTGKRLSGREAAIARRQALSQFGKSAISKSKTSAARSATEARLAARNESAGTSEAPQQEKASCGCQHEAKPSAIVEYARPAAVQPAPISAARKRRMEQSLKGRGDAPPCRPCGRIRPEPPKVEIGTTLSGSTVTGNQVERISRVTGNEASTCRTITGTEYVGAEQFGEFCASLPEPSPAKGGLTTTSSGRQVTGTEVGRSTKVTGDEYGTCKKVTGSEYLAAETLGEFCGTTPEPRPEKVDVGMTEKHQTVTGSDLNRKARVTGNEPGTQRAITGSAYADAAAVPNAEASSPKKVQTSHTSAGAPVSGTRVGQSLKVTGDEQGSCKRVTGTDYIASEDYISFCRAEPFQPPAKVGVSPTLKGQQVSGTQVGRAAGVTGDESGTCKPITGSSYIGADQYAEFCASRVAAEAINRARQGRSPALTGTQPGPDAKLTGNEGGLCQPVSGTPYVGEDQSAEACGSDPVAPVSEPSGDFSIVTPARMANNSTVRSVTGSAYGDNGRITGPMARALGLISGTPEFRYRDENTNVAAIPAAPDTPERITGEGRERRITGDAWDRGDRITGTEGRSAQRRNPTMRGDSRGNGVGAHNNRELERPAAAPSRVTGSSGNSSAGAMITMSGGARG